MNKHINFSNLLSFTSEKFRTIQNYDKVQVVYIPTGKTIGQLTVAKDGEIVLFDKEGCNIHLKNNNTISGACYALLKKINNF